MWRLVDSVLACAPGRARTSSRSAVVAGIAWSDELDEELRDGVTAGVTVEELADHLELTEDAVRTRIEQLGLDSLFPL